MSRLIRLSVRPHKLDKRTPASAAPCFMPLAQTSESAGSQVSKPARVDKWRGHECLQTTAAADRLPIGNRRYSRLGGLRHGLLIAARLAIHEILNLRALRAREHD